jgi:hypothetical protein
LSDETQPKGKDETGRATPARRYPGAEARRDRRPVQEGREQFYDEEALLAVNPPGRKGRDGHSAKESSDEHACCYSRK